MSEISLWSKNFDSGLYNIPKNLYYSGSEEIQPGGYLSLDFTKSSLSQRTFPITNLYLNSIQISSTYFIVVCTNSDKGYLYFYLYNNESTEPINTFSKASSGGVLGVELVFNARLHILSMYITTQNGNVLFWTFNVNVLSETITFLKEDVIGSYRTASIICVVNSYVVVAVQTSSRTEIFKYKLDAASGWSTKTSLGEMILPEGGTFVKYIKIDNFAGGYALVSDVGSDKYVLYPLNSAGNIGDIVYRIVLDSGLTNTSSIKATYVNNEYNYWDKGSTSQEGKILVTYITQSQLHYVTVLFRQSLGNFQQLKKGNFSINQIEETTGTCTLKKLLSSYSLYKDYMILQIEATHGSNTHECVAFLNFNNITNELYFVKMVSFHNFPASSGATFQNGLFNFKRMFGVPRYSFMFFIGSKTYYYVASYSWVAINSKGLQNNIGYSLDTASMDTTISCIVALNK